MRHKSRVALVVAVVVFGACADAPQASNVPDLFFPTYPQEGAVMAALFRGPLVVQARCVLMGKAGDYALPVWPDGFATERDETGRLTVRDADGATIAIEGKVFEVGGGYRAEFYPGEAPAEVQIQRLEKFLGYGIPERCLKADVYGVWLVGDTAPLAA
jgi:hypothetical protein